MIHELVEAVDEFHRKNGLPVNMEPKVLNYEEAAARQMLVDEEYNEVYYAFKDFTRAPTVENYAHWLHELGDLLYVIAGVESVSGICLSCTVLEHIHRSNMSKNGTINADGKVTKGAGHVPAGPAILEAIKETIDNG